MGKCQVTLLSGHDHLDMECVERTQAMILNQLKSNIHIYGYIQHLYKKILNLINIQICPLIAENNSEEFDISMIPSELKDKMILIENYWKQILVDLAKRQLALFNFIHMTNYQDETIISDVFYYTFDKNFANYVKPILDKEGYQFMAVFLREYMESWIARMEVELSNIFKFYHLYENDDSCDRLRERLSIFKRELALQYINWTILTQDPFITSDNWGHFDAASCEEFSKKFSKVCFWNFFGFKLNYI